jgi:hypothetical protein
LWLPPVAAVAPPATNPCAWRALPAGWMSAKHDEPPETNDLRLGFSEVMSFLKLIKARVEQPARLRLEI